MRCLCCSPRAALHWRTRRRTYEANVGGITVRVIDAMSENACRALFEQFRSMPMMSRSVLSPYEVWTTPEVGVWEAEGVEHQPFFYPLYQHGNLYSHSPLPLILNKGYIAPNMKYENKIRVARRAGVPYVSSNETIDEEIVRVGKPLRSLYEITGEDALVDAVTSAMVSDIRNVEDRFPGYTNLILCGGKDSLNLLLLPWENPVRALSAKPEHPLVQEFIHRNGLPYHVRELRNEGDCRSMAVLANCGRCDPDTINWLPELRQETRQHKHKVIVWMGSMADAWLTPGWRRYYVHAHRWARLQRVYKKRSGAFATQRRFTNTSYFRGAMWQGVCHSVMQTVLGVPVLSGYHGPAISDVQRRVCLRGAVRRDIRPVIGARLASSDVWYPRDTTGPGRALKRKLNRSEEFFHVLADIGIEVRVT